MSMEHYTLYHNEIPAVLAACEAAPCMRRLQNVGMNCGCEYTAFPRFRDLAPYSRFDHSLGVARIVWRFTHDEKQAVAGLLHDVASPVFAHVVDFLHGDYLVQESTEDGTEAIIARDETLLRALKNANLTVGDVCDYHRYPIADNDSPRLSADRLEYTLGNLLNYRIRTLDAVKAMYEDLTVGDAEDGKPELTFRTPAIAKDFTEASLVCSEIYVSAEDRYAMKMLSEVLKTALERGVLTEADLMTTEPAVIEKLLSDETTRAAWRNYRRFSAMLCADAPWGGAAWRQIPAKKRYIDPLIEGRGRVSAAFPDAKERIDAFLRETQTQFLAAVETAALDS